MKNVGVVVLAVVFAALLTACGGAGSSTSAESGGKSFKQICLEAREGPVFRGVIAETCREKGITATSPPATSSEAVEAREADARQEAASQERANESPASEKYDRSVAVLDVGEGNLVDAKTKLEESCQKASASEFEEASRRLRQISAGPEASSVPPTRRRTRRSLPALSRV